MCLAIPMKLIDVSDDANGKAESEGVEYKVDLSLIEEPTLGDYLIVHAGYAIEKLDQDEAELRLKMFKELSHTE